MERKIAVAIIGGCGSILETKVLMETIRRKALEHAMVILDEESIVPNEPTPYEIQMLPEPKIEPRHSFEDNKHKNQPWAKRGKNIKR